MRRRYASSVYSQKSTTSAKSGRSFLSLNTPAIWPSSKEPSLNESKAGVWKSLRSWIPKRAKDSSDTKSILSTVSSTTSSIGKLKRLLSTTKKTSSETPSPLSVDSNSSTTEKSVSGGGGALHSSVVDGGSVASLLQVGATTASSTNGILQNCGGDSAEALARQEQRRQERRERLLQLQLGNGRGSQRQSIASDISIKPPSVRSRRQVTFLPDDNVSSEDTLLNDDYVKPMVTFVEPSPVPRFRNVAPAPPPSPIYLHVSYPDQPSRDSLIVADEGTGGPTVYQTVAPDDLESQPQWPHPTLSQKSRLEFRSPLRSGMTLRFSLTNETPQDHLIVYKFLTVNVKRDTARPSAGRIAGDAVSARHEVERYFVRPSAGRIVDEHQPSATVDLILNHVPEMLVRDKILVRYAVIQRNTEIGAYVLSMQESNRRKWLEMLEEKWQDQVTLRESKIKIRFT